MPETVVEEAVWLQQYDSSYYDRDGRRPLPVLRVRYSDSAHTWLYLDPQHGVIVHKEEQLSRANRGCITDCTVSTFRSCTTGGRCGISS